MDIVLQLITSFFTLISVWLAGNGDQRFNFIGLGNQILWTIVIVRSETYGIFVLTAAMTFTYTRNIYKHYWRTGEQ